MPDPVRHRTAVRARLRATLVAAARELAVARGWREVRMADVAAAAGVSRQTVYNEFGDKSGLADALAAAEIDRFLDAVRAALRGHGTDIRAAARAAIGVTLDDAADNLLIKSIVRGGEDQPDPLLPYLTTRPQLILEATVAVLHEWASTLPGYRADQLEIVFDSIVRLVISHLTYPTASPQQSANDLADLLARMVSAAGR
ncbi:TetR family transcriptional regulator [Asanoa sp. WMMD1127]|uniref:TetR family transcriptional regulator n=1 Tax=Asanoa sp. WMMD1127 TaxID=3016107 RepID=UPI00241663CA|nr:TetR family transcriptional regulator [Asanoa sp. WMMD1127]MDG4821693.1 TetR family transcriptional regulator [Asanoa sp. WMMD1127]